MPSVEMDATEIPSMHFALPFGNTAAQTRRMGSYLTDFAQIRLNFI